MIRNFRIAGRTFLVLGTVLSGVTLLGIAGITPVNVEIGPWRVSPGHHPIFAAAWGFAAVGGAGLIWSAHWLSRRQSPESDPGSSP